MNWLQKIKRHSKLIYTSALFAALFFLLGFVVNYQVPKIKQWLLIELEKQSQKHSPVRVWAQQMDFRILPLGVKFYNIKILPKKELEKILPPTEIAEASVTLSPWALFKAQLHIGTLKVKGSELHLQLKTSQTTKREPITIDILRKLPIDYLEIEDVKFHIELPDEELAISAENLQVSIQNRYSTLRSSINMDRFKLFNKKENYELSFDLDTNFLVDKDGIYFSKLNLSHENSTVNLAGSAAGNIFATELKSIQAKVFAELKLQDIQDLVEKFKVSADFPALSGEVKLQMDASHIFNADLTRAHYDVNSENLRIGKFHIGQLSTNGQVNDKVIQIAKMQVKNFFGTIFLEKAQLKINEQMNFSGKVRTDHLELSRFLNAIGVKKVPVYTTARGEFPCKGQLKPQLQLNCDGSFSGDEMLVETGGADPTPIVAFNDYRAKGTLSVDERQVKYQADLQIGNSKGTSDGVINYETGFDINYETPQLLLSDIKNIVNLRPEGHLAIKGNTRGNSETGRIKLEASGDQLWLYDFALGKAKFNMEYKNGFLSFNRFAGQIESSQYQSEFAIDLLNNSIKGAAQMPYLNSKDAIYAFSRKINVPIEISGTGSASVNFHGPLNFSELSYDFNSTFFRGAIAGETYDQIQFKVGSKNGLVTTDRVNLKKGRSQIRAQGSINPSGLLDLNLIGRNFSIEQSENISKLKVDLTGNINFDVKLTDKITNPSVEMSGIISQTNVGEFRADNSTFFLKYNDDALDCGIQLLGNALNLTFNRPSNANAFSRFTAKAQAWNFAQTFSVFSDTLRTGNYITSLTGDAYVDFPNSDWKKFNGQIALSEVFLRNGRIEMKSDQLLKMSAENGIIKTNNFELKGENTFLRLVSNSSEADQLKLHLDARMELSLLTLFTPFLDDLRGIAKFSFHLNGALTSPRVSGSVRVEDALVKIKDFPHPLEQLQGDAVLNQEKIIINSLKGRIASGAFNSSGKIELNDVSNVEVDIRGQFLDSRFNVPTGFRTRGSGDFSITGKWFPYIIGVNFAVDSGSVELTGSGQDKETREVKPSPYLPQSLTAQRFSPINLDLNINLKRQLPVKMDISRIEIRTDITGQMRIVGPTENPLLTGTIGIVKGGTITLRNNTFEVITGAVEYKNSAPDNPQLDIRAEARVTAIVNENETREYDVDLRVLGEAQDPKITMSSNPPLPENELISLLTLGFINTANTTETEDEAGQLTTTSYQLGSAIISEQLGLNRLLEQSFGLKLDINSSYDSTDKAEKHKFTLRKQWTPKFGTTASREIGKVNSNNVKAEYKLNDNVSVIGEWEGLETTTTDQTTTADEESNVFGLDLEYKMEFK